MQEELIVLKTISNLVCFQLRIKATDKGVPPLEDETTLEVSVVKDQGLLRFSNPVFEARVSENKEIGGEVTRVSASPAVSLCL